MRFEKSLTENWYLQIAVEMGIAGLFLFLLMLATLSKRLLTADDETNGRGLFLALLGIGIAALFTHAFEETTAMIIFAILAGGVLKRSH
ncbi:hypothetical protein HYV58_00725 [Candidatus Peregrinibacteria bacterium]|nr:hypothetical protein [Candidatus Peregrinibacteria bacterium]